MPRAVYVLISGCAAASAGSMTGDSATAKRSKPPSGAGTEMVRPLTAPRPSRGACSSTSASASWSSVKVADATCSHAALDSAAWVAAVAVAGNDSSPTTAASVEMCMPSTLPRRPPARSGLPYRAGFCETCRTVAPTPMQSPPDRWSIARVS